MLKSIIWILFNNGCEAEKERNRKGGGKWGVGRERMNKQKIATTHGSSDILLVLFHSGLLGSGGPYVI